MSGLRGWSGGSLTHLQVTQPVLTLGFLARRRTLSDAIDQVENLAKPNHANMCLSVVVVSLQPSRWPRVPFAPEEMRRHQTLLLVL
jgi:hypothetical protein